MTTRGTTIKRDTPDTLTLTRPMITRRYELVADHQKCVGCKICATVCPREAITLWEGAVVDGRMTARPRIDIDEKRCNFCGECVALCPTRALSITINGERRVPVQDGNAFPLLIRKMEVDPEPCRATTDTAYITNCPSGAISAAIRYGDEGQVVAVDNVAVDREKCINCTRCMEEGPQGAFNVTKPYRGRAALNTALCPPGCRACADICPAKTISYDGEKVSVDRRFCLFCGACENICPVEGAVHITRTGLIHTPVESGAWMSALEKLISFREVTREYDAKRQDKRRKLVLSALLLEKTDK